MNDKRIKKLVSAFVVGAFAISLPITADAKRIHDSKVSTKSEARQFSKKDKTIIIERIPSIPSKTSKEVRTNNTKVNTRVGAILNPDSVLRPSAEVNSVSYPAISLDSTQETFVPKTVSVYDTSISGTPMATQEQCVKYLLANNPYPNLAVPAEEIVAYYYEEGAREGIRPDVAFAQALKETGFFSYGGDVIPEQNNYCGLGTTGGGVKGEFFATAQMGVRAHIQHLLAYSSTRRPLTPIIDPRYDIVRNTYGERILGDWQDLNGRWAVPGRYYGQEILSMFKAILAQ